MRILDLVLAGIVMFVLAVSLLNPGGAIVAVGIVVILLGLRYGLPFVRDYYVSAHSGSKGRVKAEKQKHSLEKNK